MNAGVPLQFSPHYIDQAHLSELAGLKRLAQAFVAEGRLAEKENRFGDAAKSYLDVIRLGNNPARGGILIDAMVGIAIEAMGTAGLQKLVDQLDAKRVVKPPQPWKRSMPKDNPGRTFCSRNEAWSRRTFPGIRYRLVELVMSSSSKKAYQAG